MPYLQNNDKDSIDNQGGIDVCEKFSAMEITDFAGALNYLNDKIVKTWIEKNGKKYFIFAVIAGTLVCCILEIYRRLIAPYEDKKISENGDI